MMNVRINQLKEYCEFKLEILNSLLTDMHDLTPDIKLRLNTKINILNHIVDYKTYGHFLNEEEINKYIEDSADIILGFYED